MFNLPEEEIVRMQREMYFDKKFGAALENASQEGVTDETGGSGGGLEAEFGSDLEGAGEEGLDEPPPKKPLPMMPLPKKKRSF